MNLGIILSVALGYLIGSGACVVIGLCFRAANYWRHLPHRQQMVQPTRHAFRMAANDLGLRLR